jgi:hypothetical protein
MAEDRLEKALDAIKSENANPAELARAHDRILEKLNAPKESLCDEFQLQLRDYRDSRIEGSRRVLIEDHLSRCTHCRAKLAEQRGDRKVVPMPTRRRSAWPRLTAWAAAAAVILMALYIGRSSIDAFLARGPRATVVSVKGNLFLVPEGALTAGSTISENAVIRTGPGSRAILRLADGSQIDVNEHTELSVHATFTEKVVHLQRGDIIVQAAKQLLGRLRVQTRDSLASVKGTVFAVSTGLNGTMVTVLEGSVAVSQAGSETILSPGGQVASNPAMESSVQQAVVWSPDVETYIGMLPSLSKIQKQLAKLPSPLLRTQSNLLQFMPSNMFVFGAVPNPVNNIGHAMQLAEQQSAENPAFGKWWNSGAGQNLKRLIDRIQTVTPLLGNEIVYGYSAIAPGTMGKIPMILAEVQTGKRNELSNALIRLGIQPGLCFRLTDTLLILSDSQSHIQWLLEHLGQGATTPFAAEITARYLDGTSWLLGLDMDSLLSFNGMPTQVAAAQQLKHIILEQRSAGIEENEIAVSFKGPRKGLASFLASNGSGGAAEYLSRDVIAAIYVSTREPRQMFEELTALIARSQPQFPSNLAKTESTLGVHFANDFASAVGTEASLSLDGISLNGFVWTLAVLLNDPPALDQFIRRMVDGCNAEFARSGQTQRITIEQEVADGRTWTTMKFDQPSLTITWTYDRGYLVAASDRGGAMRAIATRNGGSPLIWSPAFQQQMPGSIGLHPSGFFWLNTKGTLQGLAALVQDPTIKKLIAERDPILVAFSASMEQIRTVSRTRFSGLILDLLQLQLGQRQPGSLQATPEGKS